MIANVRNNTLVRDGRSPNSALNVVNEIRDRRASTAPIRCLLPSSNRPHADCCAEVALTEAFTL